MAPAEQSTLSGESLKDLDREEPTTPAEAVKEVAEAKQPDRLPPAMQSSALDWFLSGEPVGGTTGNRATVRVNVGSEDDPKWIDWVLKPVSMDSLRAIRQRASSTREAKRTGNMDEFRMNLEIVAISTVDPPLGEVAAANGIDAIEALRERFGNSPGIITQLSGKVLGISGFDEDDVQDKVQVTAAGNS